MLLVSCLLMHMGHQLLSWALVLWAAFQHDGWSSGDWSNWRPCFCAWASNSIGIVLVLCGTGARGISCPLLWFVLVVWWFWPLHTPCYYLFELVFWVCLCPILSSSCLIGTASQALMYKAPNLASAVLDITVLRIVDAFSTALLLGGSSTLLDQKKCHPTRLLASVLLS